VRRLPVPDTANSRLFRNGGCHEETESQIVAILKEGDAGVALSELTMKHVVLPSATLFCRS
jgi:hypothetical protein